MLDPKTTDWFTLLSLPVACAGTGEANVKGLLRRAEATDIVRKIKEGELRPGEAQELLRATRERASAAATAAVEAPAVAEAVEAPLDAWADLKG